MVYINEIEKISEIDKKLLKNHDLKIDNIRKEKIVEIVDTLVERVDKLCNLINDIEYIKSNKCPKYLKKKIGYLIECVIDENYIQLVNEIKSVYCTDELYNSIELYSKYELEYKQYYLKNLERIMNIKVR